MTTRAAVDRLMEHPSAILAIIDRSEAMVATADTFDGAALARSRWELTRALTAYQLFKDREIFEPALRTGAPAQQALAAGMKDQCVALGDEFRDYVARWGRRG